MQQLTNSKTSWPLILSTLVAALFSGCSQAPQPSSPVSYWGSIVTLTEAFEADAETAVAASDLQFAAEDFARIDANSDGRIVRAELWAHQQEQANRPYAGPRDLSEMSGLREGGFPLNVDPEIVSVDEVSLGDEDLIMGIVIDGQARAYPVNYMNGPLNEVVNDTLAGQPIASTW